jgi:enoyl-CoA hydratase/carnithine racemase
MSNKRIHCEVSEEIATITIDHPPINLIDLVLLNELKEQFSKLRGDETVWAVILTGAGDRTFVGGMDVRQLTTTAPEVPCQVSIQGQMTMNFIENLGKPTIAAINGVAIGGGLELALACTFRIGTPKSRFASPEIKLGIIPGFGATQRLPRLIGTAKAMEMLLTGDQIDAEKALQLGILNQLVEEKKLMSAARELARRVISNPGQAVKMTMEAVNRGIEMPLDYGLRLESLCAGYCNLTEDSKEGLNALLEKRKPIFRNR